MSIVTFTSDFGTADGYVGAMKGVVLTAAPGTKLVDITHEVRRHDVAAGAFALAQAAPFFPGGSIHVAVVDPGVGTSRAAVLVETENAFFVGPDNGLFALVAPTPRAVYAITEPGFRRPGESATFHGRDVFAQTAGRLAQGVPARQAGVRLEALAPLPEAVGDPHTAPEQARVIHVDAFGNLITSRPGSRLDFGDWMLTFFHGPDAPSPPMAVRAARTYGEVGPGELVVYVGSAGLVEIAVRDGSAAERLGLARGAVLTLVKA